MLCDLCMELMTSVLAQNSATQDHWKVSDICACRNGYYEDIKATCESDCKLCWLFCKSVEDRLAEDQKTHDTSSLGDPTPVEVLHKRDTITPWLELVAGTSDPLRVDLKLFQASTQTVQHYSQTCRAHPNCSCQV
jgi:hypothetical protein